MKDWLHKNKLTLAGVIIGAVAGFTYWKFIGCASGTCPIKSDPIYSSLYGAMVGGLLFNLFRKNTSSPHANNK